jgi:hypothetical protein
VFKIPLNGWPKDMRLKHVGMMWQRNMLEGLSAFSLGMFSRFLGKTVEEIEVSSPGCSGSDATNPPSAAVLSRRPEEPFRPQRALLPQAVRSLGPKARSRVALAQDRVLHADTGQYHIPPYLLAPLNKPHNKPLQLVTPSPTPSPPTVPTPP